MVGSAPLSDGQTHANARLIAAAPVLLTALVEAEAVLSIVEPRSHKAEYLSALATVRTAIAQASGGVG